jgi:predicted metal-dependent phosphoesterase TrpH
VREEDHTTMKPTAWSKADLHIHTNYSKDAIPDVASVLEYAATRTDLKVIAITDHDAIAGALEARRLAPHYGIAVIVGEEVSTTEGHLLALFIEEFLPPGRPAAETIAAVHAQGGLCVAAHPYAWMIPSMGWNGLHQRCCQKDTPEWSLDGIEGFNAGLWIDHNNALATRMSQRLNLAVCGGSDAHHLSTIGNGYTLFPGTTAEDVRRAIVSRQTSAGGTSWGWPRTAEYLRLKLKTIARDIAGRVPRPSLP